MSIEDIEKAFEEAKKNAPPMFHPVYERSEGAWFPSNEAANVASIISHTWEDILCVIEIRKSVKNEIGKKLLFKYIIIELCSILEQLERLQQIIFQIIKGPTHDQSKGYISTDQSEEVTNLFRKYRSLKKHLEGDLKSIRNYIGAHRSTRRTWNDIMKFWDKLEPKNFMDLFIFLPELFEYIRKLDIYDWGRIPEEGVIEICCGGLNIP